jgi:DNA invertase Pin-like site-specific DNA recombinase
MLIGYMRVSKKDGSQHLDLQKDALLAAGVQEDRIYQDCGSGRNSQRPGLEAGLKALQPGNILVVWKLDRLGRNLKDLVMIVEGLRQREVGFKVLAGAGAEIDTSTANGRLFFAVFAALAEYEAELISERTRAGLQAARARGRMGGRPRKMDRVMLQMLMEAMKNPEAYAKAVAQRLNISTATLYSYVNGDGTPKEAGLRLLRKAHGEQQESERPR